MEKKIKGVYEHGNYWYIRYRPAKNTPQLRECTGTQADCGPVVHKGEKDGQRKAAKYLDNVMKKCHAAEVTGVTFLGNRQGKVTLAQCIQAYQEKHTSMRLKKGKAVRPAFISDCKRTAKIFDAENCKALDLTDTFWAKWLIHDAPELLEDYQKSTLNRSMEIVHAALDIAKTNKMISELPCNLYDFLYDEDNIRHGFFEYEEFQRLLAATDDEDLKDFYWFAYLVGWRTGSIKKLEWSMIDLKTGVIHLPWNITKEEHKNHIPMGVLGKYMFDLIERRLARRVYTNKEGMESISRFVFHRQGVPIGDTRIPWAQACEKAGLLTVLLDRKGNPVLKNGKPVMVASKILHDFRRTAARDIYTATGNKDLAKSITGHYTDAVFDRYNIIVNDQKVEAIEQRMAYVTAKGANRHEVTSFEHRASTDGNAHGKSASK